MSDRVCVFGEVLFDHFPDGKRVLGGAPFNVAWHLQAFGLEPRFISRVGNDPEGEAVVSAMHKWGMDVSGVQSDPVHPTGVVEVQFAEGEPSYDIVEPCAYDAIEVDAQNIGLFYHGSLALRSPASRRAAQALRSAGPETVFIDVNLRPPWWQAESVLEMVEGADWVKLNVDELAKLDPGSEPGASGAISFLSEHSLDGLILTRGSKGADVFTAGGDRFSAEPDPKKVAVVDTVGAGDAFASVMILGLMRSWAPPTTVTRAQAFASAVVGQRGATNSEPVFYQPFIDDWNL